MGSIYKEKGVHKAENVNNRLKLLFVLALNVLYYIQMFGVLLHSGYRVAG